MGDVANNDSDNGSNHVGEPEKTTVFNDQI